LNADLNAERGRILVLDDDLDMRDLLTSLFLEAGLAVEAVASVPAAWSALEREPFDVMISDHELARDEGTGVELLGQLAIRQPHVSRILLTGWIDDPQVKEMAGRSRDDGLTLVFYKPVDGDDLLSWVGNGIAMARLARAKARFA
jgi:DNA-binding NtrC family response regulator